MMKNVLRTTATARTPDLKSPAGPQGIALTPPAYGIDFLDRTGNEAGAETVLQRKAAPPATGDDSRKLIPNHTGLPDGLKSGIEHLSGLSLDDVRVHYNSSKPKQLQALAYTQGADIHVATGQERHLPHEAWHVVQQKQGRVQATLQAKGIPINDDRGLEREADIMGAKALRRQTAAPKALEDASVSKFVVQGLFDWAVDAANSRRKVGVEITEANAGGNGISELQPTAPGDYWRRSPKPPCGPTQSTCRMTPERRTYGRSPPPTQWSRQTLRLPMGTKMSG